MTKWVCNNKRCGGTDPCRVELAPWFAPPENCLYSAGSACWKRDCTEERSSAVFDAFAGVDNRVCHLEKKVQDLITAGQGQMARIQALEKKIPDTWVMWSDRVEELEYRVKSLQNAHFQAQLHAHTWRLEEIEKRVRQLDGHTHERFKCDV